jgi:hypothetical protein
MFSPNIANLLLENETSEDDDDTSTEDDDDVPPPLLLDDSFDGNTGVMSHNHVSIPSCYSFRSNIDVQIIANPFGVAQYTTTLYSMRNTLPYVNCVYHFPLSTLDTHPVLNGALGTVIDFMPSC